MTAKPQPAGSWSGDGVPSPVIVKIPIVLGGGTPSSSVPHSVMHSPSSGLASPTYPSSGLRTTKHLLGHAADVTPQRMSSQGWEEEQIELRSACTPTDPAEQAPCPRPPWLTPRACFLICRWHRLLKSLLVLSPWVHCPSQFGAPTSDSEGS